MTKVQVQDDAWGVRHKPTTQWIRDRDDRVTLLSEQNAKNFCISSDYEAVKLRVEISVADSANGDVIDLHDKAVELLNHLGSVLDDKNFDKINAKLWNDVSMFLVNNSISR